MMTLRCLAGTELKRFVTRVGHGWGSDPRLALEVEPRSGLPPERAGLFGDPGIRIVTDGIGVVRWGGDQAGSGGEADGVLVRRRRRARAPAAHPPAGRPSASPGQAH